MDTLLLLQGAYLPLALFQRIVFHDVDVHEFGLSVHKFVYFEVLGFADFTEGFEAAVLNTDLF